MRNAQIDKLFLSSSLTIIIIYKTGNYLTSKIPTILCRHPSRPSKNCEYIHNSKFLSHQNSTRQSIVYLYISIHPSESSIAVLHVETIQQQQTVIVISRDDQVFTTRSCFLCFTYIRYQYLVNIYILLLLLLLVLHKNLPAHQHNCQTENDFPT